MEIRKFWLFERSKRVLDILQFYAKGIWYRLESDDVFVWAAAIAFKMLIAFIPLLIMATGVIGWILQSFLSTSDPYLAINRFLATFLPQYQNREVVQGINSLARAGQRFTYIGSASLFILSISLFTTLQTVVSHIFKEERVNRSLWRSYLFDARMVIQVGSAFVVSILLTLILTAVKQTGDGYLETLPNVSPQLIALWGSLANGILYYLLPLLVTMAMFFQLYYFVPKPHPPVKSVIAGTLFTAVLWELAKNLFAWYASTLRPFDRYGASHDALVPALGDFFGITMALVFWAYYSGLVFILGGMMAALHEKARRKGLH